MLHSILSGLVLTLSFMLPVVQERDPGWTVRVYEVGEPIDELVEIAAEQTPNVDFVAPDIDLRQDGFGAVHAPFVTVVEGRLHIEAPGRYVFALTSDDGSRLTFDGETVIEHDGRHGFTTRESSAVALEPGFIEVRIEHFDGGGGRGLRLRWRLEEETEFSAIPTQLVTTERDLTRVTSPGPKAIANAKRPGDGKPLIGVHPGWRVESLRPPGFEPKVGALARLPDGRLVVGTFDPLQRDDRSLPDIDSKRSDRLFALAGWDRGDPAAIDVREIAAGVYEPTGLCVIDGELYVAHRKCVTRLTDADGDGYYETHTTVAAGWEGWNYHQFAFGLEHRDGKLYTALSTAMAPPGWEGMETNAGPNGPLRGSVLEIDLATGEVAVIAGGTRTPNGLGFGPDGALLYADNQGTWFPASAIGEVTPGTFFGHYNWTRRVTRLAERFPAGGHPSAYCDRLVTPPAVWLPQGEVNNSPTQIQRIPDGPFKDQIYVAELTAGGIRRVFLERVNGRLQGAVFRFTQGLEAGVNRLILAPDGSLIAGGMGAGGNWNWRGTQFGLERLVPTGESAFEYHSIEARPRGFVVRFTSAVPVEWLAEPTHYRIEQFTYRPTAAYGGPKVDSHDVAVRRATPAADGRSVELELDGLKPGYCVHFHIDPVSTDGEPIWSPDAWYTLNAIPRERAPQSIRLNGEELPVTRLDVGARASGDAIPLLNGPSSSAMVQSKADFPPNPMTQDDLMGSPAFTVVEPGQGNLVTKTRFGDARFHIEWLAPPGGEGQRAGNSGVYLQGRYEIQVLGTAAGAKTSTSDAGAIYGVRAPSINASRGPGEWQCYDIWFRAARSVDGEVSEPARVTVVWNGLVVHDDVALETGTGAQRDADPIMRHGIEIGPLVLQDHASDAEGPVRYRNVWVKPLEAHPRESRAGDWIELFAEEARTDWVIRGGDAEYRFEDGILIGTCVPNSPNTFYTSRKRYDDFELVYDVRVHPSLNSGVQIRSEVMGGFDNRTGGLTGYQIEVDPSDRAYTAGIYDERGRGWLHPLHANPAARRTFRPGDWNRIRVVARGPIIETWLNGVPAASLFDAERTDGHLGFQVHGVGPNTTPWTVEFRNARLRRL